MRKLLHRLDVALWRLPRWARKVVVAPALFVIVVLLALKVALREARDEWRAGMAHVHVRPWERENG